MYKYTAPVPPLQFEHVPKEVRKEFFCLKEIGDLLKLLPSLPNGKRKDSFLEALQEQLEDASLMSLATQSELEKLRKLPPVLDCRNAEITQLKRNFDSLEKELLLSSRPQYLFPWWSVVIGFVCLILAMLFKPT